MCTFSTSAVFGADRVLVVGRCVRFVVPTSTSSRPARAMISGMRNAPPISISSPRETMASRPCASVLSTSSTAAALLLTTVASSAAGQLAQQLAHVIVALAAPTAVEVELERDGFAHRIVAASIAGSARSARPRFVWSTVPVRLNTAGSSGAVARLETAERGCCGGVCRERGFARFGARRSDGFSNRRDGGLPAKLLVNVAASGVRSTASTEGKPRLGVLIAAPMSSRLGAARGRRRRAIRRPRDNDRARSPPRRRRPSRPRRDSTSPARTLPAAQMPLRGRAELGVDRDTPGRVERRELAHEAPCSARAPGRQTRRPSASSESAPPVLDAQRTHRVVAEDFRDSGAEAQLDLRMRAHTLAKAHLARERSRPRSSSTTSPT